MREHLDRAESIEVRTLAFSLANLWPEHSLEQLWQQLDVAGQHEVLQRPGIGGDQRHVGSEAEPLPAAL